TVGGDVPVHAGAVMLTPGIGVGVGSMHTRRELTERMHVRSEIEGVRGDAHATLSYPIAGRFALDVSASIVVARSIDRDQAPHQTFPDAPGVLVNLGAGLRYG